MSAPISVIMPTLNSTAGLAGSLPPLLDGVLSGLVYELILTDGGSDDHIDLLAEDLGANLVKGPAGRGGQLRRGANKARAPWLLFLHSDTVLTSGWTEPVRYALEDQTRAHFFKLSFDATGPAPAWVAGWANWRARNLGLPYGDQGLLVHRDLYHRVGGFPDIPLMEDVALARRLKGCLSQMEGVVRTSAARYEAEGYARRGSRNLLLLSRYLMGADPQVLASAYKRPSPGN